jgi:hypothetical protein
LEEVKLIAIHPLDWQHRFDRCSFSDQQRTPRIASHPMNRPPVIANNQLAGKSAQTAVKVAAAFFECK